MAQTYAEFQAAKESLSCVNIGLLVLGAAGRGAFTTSTSWKGPGLLASARFHKEMANLDGRRGFRLRAAIHVWSAFFGQV